MLRPLPPLTVYYLFATGTALLFTLYATLSAVYRFETVGLTPFELVLVGTVLEGTVFLFELPTGVVADAVSRRLSVLIGMVLIGAGFLLEGLVPSLAAVLAAQVVWGLGATFESGAVDAWISDEIGEAAATRAFLRAAQLGQLAALAGIPVAVALGRAGLGLPLAAAGVGYLALAGLLAATMTETGFAPAAAGDRHPLRAAGGVLRRGLELGRRRPALLLMLGVALFVGAHSETFDRLWEAHLLADTAFPVTLDVPTWFGLLAFAATLLSVAATEVARRRLDAADGRALPLALAAITLLQSGAVLLFGLAGRFDLAVGAYFAATVLRRLHAPLYRAWLNRGLEPATRATAFSAAAQLDALGQLLGGPLLGLLASAAGMPLAFVAAALLLTPAAWLILRAARRRPVPARPR